MEKQREKNGQRNGLVHYLLSFNRGRAVILCTSAEPECSELVAAVAQRARDALQEQTRRAGHVDSAGTLRRGEVLPLSTSTHPIPSLGPQGSPRAWAGVLPVPGTLEPLMPPLPPAAFSSHPLLTSQSFIPAPMVSHPFPWQPMAPSPFLPALPAPTKGAGGRGCLTMSCVQAPSMSLAQPWGPTQRQIETAQLIAAMTRARSQRGAGNEHQEPTSSPRPPAV